MASALVTWHRQVVKAYKQYKRELAGVTYLMLKSSIERL